MNNCNFFLVCINAKKHILFQREIRITHLWLSKSLFSEPNSLITAELSNVARKICFNGSGGTATAAGVNFETGES